MTSPHFDRSKVIPIKRSWHPVRRNGMNNDMTLDNLIRSLLDIHRHFAAETAKAVNVSLTLRNWLIGAYISEYQLNGADRATYGDDLLGELANRLTGSGVSNCNRRQLYRYLRFYRLYPDIAGILPVQARRFLPEYNSGTTKKVGTVYPQLHVSPDKLIGRLSYSHLELIADLEDRQKRAFYEFECIRGNWSVRELKRQINSLYFERSGLSKNKKKLGESVRTSAEQAEPKLAIRDPYIFEFLGIKPQEVMHESDLEDSLLDKLQDFLLELGMVFVLKPGKNAFS